MINNYAHEIIIVLWVILTFILSIPSTPILVPIIWTIYCVVVIWFLMAWRRADSINLKIKLIASLGLTYWFFLTFVQTNKIIKLLYCPKSTSIYIKNCNKLINLFMICFIVALIISPLVISLYKKHSMYLALVIAVPTFSLSPPGNFSTIDESAFTVGVYSVTILAIIVATYLASAILHPLVKTKITNKVVDSGVESPVTQGTFLKYGVQKSTKLKAYARGGYMFKTILKYVFCGILVFVSYKALQIYAMFGVSKKLVAECGMSNEAMDDLVRRKAPGWEVEKFTHEKYSCLNNKQNIVENFFFPVPENWINPVPGSLTYKDVIKKKPK